jgi:hypothetical protein
MFNAANPLLHGNGSGGVYNTQDANAEMAQTHDRVPAYLAAVLIGSAGILLFLNKANFRFVGTASGGLGKG